MAIRTSPGVSSGTANGIWAQGIQAGQAGAPASSNPYPPGSAAWALWINAWHSGGGGKYSLGGTGSKKPGAGSSPKTGNLQQGAAQNWQPCTLTWYDPALGGTNSASGAANPHATMANGQPYNANADTCAAPPSYSFGTYITFRYGGKTVTCMVTDRGGAIQGSHFDLSRHAADTLGIVNAGTVQASFAVGKGGPPGSGSRAPGGFGGGVSVLQILEDIATLNVSDLAVQMALVSVTVVKDVTLGIADFILIPFWQWNQRAVAYFIDTELFSQTDWTAVPWTAAFWGLGYWLLWTDPSSNSLKPVPVRQSRLARHVRGLQSLPARRSLVKPKDVKRKTPLKPKVVTSTAVVASTGTMRATRTLPVKVSGEHAALSETRVQPAGSVPAKNPNERRKGPNPTRPESHPEHRTRDSSLSDRSRDSRRGTSAGKGSHGRGAKHR